jgi:hypothetical protein
MTLLGARHGEVVLVHESFKVSDIISMARGEVSYSGKRDGWTLTPPYSVLSRILFGTKRPNETATMRLIGSPSTKGN